MKNKIISKTIDITPNKPMQLAGYVNCISNYTHIDSPLEVNFLLINDLILISIDTLYITEDLKNKILDKTNIPSEKLLLAATHTHFAPAIDESKLPLGKPDKDYKKLLINKITNELNELCKKEYNQIKPSLLYNKSSAYHSINRRVIKDGGEVHFKPNYKGEKSEDIHTIIIMHNSEPLSVIVSYACHPTSSPNKTHVSPDYIFEIRQTIRKKYQKKIPVLFFQGFSGNTRPTCIKEDYSKFQPFSQTELTLWRKSLSLSVNNALHNMKVIPFDGIQTSLKKLPFHKIIESHCYKGQISFHHIKIGTILFIAVGSEVVSEYTLLLKDYYKDLQVIPISCANDAFGYLPTDKIIEEGGYEGGEFFKSFGIHAVFKPQIEEKIKKYLLYKVDN